MMLSDGLPAAFLHYSELDSQARTSRVSDDPQTRVRRQQVESGDALPMAVPATKWDRFWAAIILFKSCVSRLFLISALFSSGVGIPPLYVAIILCESIGNLCVGLSTKSYFPGALSNYIHVLYYHEAFTGYYPRSPIGFSHWTKLRMCALCLSLNLAIAISSYDQSQRLIAAQDQQEATLTPTLAPTSGPTYVPPSVSLAWSTARVVIPLVLELYTILLNSIFVLVLECELFARCFRYVLLLCHATINALLCSCFPLHHDDYTLWPLTFHTKQHAQRLNQYQNLSEPDDDDMEDVINHQTQRQTHVCSISKMVRLDQLWSGFYPIYAFLYRWIG